MAEEPCSSELLRDSCRVLDALNSFMAGALSFPPRLTLVTSLADQQNLMGARVGQEANGSRASLRHHCALICTDENRELVDRGRGPCWCLDCQAGVYIPRAYEKVTRSDKPIQPGLSFWHINMMRMYMAGPTAICRRHPQDKLDTLYVRLAPTLPPFISRLPPVPGRLNIGHFRRGGRSPRSPQGERGAGLGNPLGGVPPEREGEEEGPEEGYQGEDRGGGGGQGSRGRRRRRRR